MTSPPPPTVETGGSASRSSGYSLPGGVGESLSLKFDEDEPQPDPELGFKIVGRIVNTQARVSVPSGPTIYGLLFECTLTYDELMEINGGRALGPLKLVSSDAILIILPDKGSDARPDHGSGAGA